jgi:hypothetical protein
MPPGAWLTPKTIFTALLAATFGASSVPPEPPPVRSEPVHVQLQDVFGAVLGAEMALTGGIDSDALGLGSFRATQNLLRGRLERRWIQAVGQSPTPGTLLYPVPTGTFGRGYGSGSGNYHSAVDIAAPVGEEILASADGIVGYAGDRLTSYGNVVLIIHAGGWVTLYAHCHELFVNTGETVTRGQLIGQVGDTGISHGPHLHYELIYDGEVCDPAPLFRPEMRRASGRLIAQPLEWTEPGERPAGLRCAPRTPHPDSRWFNQSDG